MNSTIRRTAESDRINITDTVVATVRALGAGHITTALVLQAINRQLRPNGEPEITERQVGRALAEIARREWLRLRPLAPGFYWLS